MNQDMMEALQALTTDRASPLMRSSGRSPTPSSTPTSACRMRTSTPG